MITGNPQDKAPITVVTELTTISLSRNINDSKEVNATATNDAANSLAKEKNPDEVCVVDKKQEEIPLVPQRAVSGKNLDIRGVQIDEHGLPEGDVVTSDEYYSYSDSYVSGAESVSSYSDTSSSEYIDSEYEEEEEDTCEYEASNKHSSKLASKRTDEKNEISLSLDDELLAAIRQKIEQEIEKKEHLTK
ncbi:MAG: hypothetical protein K2L13_02965 [Opitutales bacterium]|nr:hypothetical protein [Opitutales bacterium]